MLKNSEKETPEISEIKEEINLSKYFPRISLLLKTLPPKTTLIRGFCINKDRELTVAIAAKKHGFTCDFCKQVFPTYKQLFKHELKFEMKNEPVPRSLLDIFGIKTENDQK